MTREDRNLLFIEFLDVCNTALLANGNSFPYKQMLAVSRKLGGRNVGLIVYEEDPDIPAAYLTVRFEDNRIEPVAEGMWEPDHTLKIKQDYMEKVVKRRREYIDHPVRLDWDWLKSRLGMRAEGDTAILVREAMTPGVRAVLSHDTVREAAETMRSFDIGAVPVVDGSTLVGILTDRDITVRAAANGLNPKTTAVEDVMSPGVFSCRDDAELTAAAEIMKQRKIRRLLVLNSENVPVGFLSAGDLATHSPHGQLAGESMAAVCERPAGPFPG